MSMSRVRQPVAKALPALAQLAGSIGDPAVRNRGTIGGSLANNDPAADYPAAVLALGAIIVTNKREIHADHFFRGMFETALEPGELITAVKLPIPAAAGYAKVPNMASRFALVGVFVAKFPTGVRVAVTGAGSGCLSRAGIRSGTRQALRARGGQRSRRRSRRAEFGYSRRGRLSRAPDQRHGQARGGGRKGRCLKPEVRGWQ